MRARRDTEGRAALGRRAGRSRRPSRLVAAVLAVAAAFPLAACTAVVTMTPAAGAGSPACAAVTVRLPDEIEGFEQRETNAQATGAWGDPTVALLHCGVDAPAPTSDLPCVTVPGGQVDWLLDDSDAPSYVFTAYGRSPSVTVVVDYSMVSGTSVLNALDQAVRTLPQTGSCVGADDVTPAPTPTG